MHAHFCCNLVVWAVDPGTRDAVEEKDRFAVQVAIFGVAQGAAVTQLKA
jgi:hypothetical protein